MGVNIGKVMEAAREGKWLEIPAIVGKFFLKVKLDLPKEFYSYSKKVQAAVATDEVYPVVFQHVKNAIVGWHGLTDARGDQIPFSEALLNDDVFMGSIFALKVEKENDKDKDVSVFVWLREHLTNAETFMGAEDPSFLANT